MTKIDIYSDLLRKILKCWYLDIEFLIDLIDEYDIDLDLEDIIQNYWYENLNVNTLIYYCFIDIKDKFLKENSKEIQKISWETLNDFEDYKIFTNCIDSHLRFTDDKINDLFEIWKSKLENNLIFKK